ncbi:MAG TPA: galactokinase family protein [Solirubrobacteraceae bacterium]|nr:galactokinase family protein [Solirubrobacteraceae bacterium]
MTPTPSAASPEIAAFAPGRVNLIGEHTDYNGGLALPFAIAAGITVSAGPGPEAGTLVVHALDLGEEDCFPLAAPDPRPGWRAFARGVVAELAGLGIIPPALALTVSGTLPRGAGLSSSAALEVALALALVAAAGAPVLEPLALARLCSRVENHWVGAHSGLLDQLACLGGTPDHALLIDFADLTLRQVPLELGDHRLIAVDSGEEHRLGDSGYNARRAECEAACAALGIATLSEATPAMIADLPDALARRARHVVSENARVRAAVTALEAGDLPGLGRLLSASHASLRNLYEVSTPAVERTVARLHAAGALGARLVGGGFGGSVVALLGPETPVPAGAMALRAGAGARLQSGGGGGRCTWTRPAP